MKIFLCVATFFIPFKYLWSQTISQNSENDSSIISVIYKHRPTKGALIPSDLNERLGATHVAGKYYFTKDPYIIEGCNKLIDMGYKVVKLWFSKSPGGYPYNSNWNLPSEVTLKQLAQHPYYKKCFNMPFTTIILVVNGAGVNTTLKTAANEKKEIYDLTKYLLEEYRHRNITFIIENWEGDWIMRGGTGSFARWSRKPGVPLHAVDGERETVSVPADTLQRCRAMIEWFTSRQVGIDSARNEVKNTKCKVLQAVEANKVMDAMEYGIPGIVNCVLPFIKTDMASWSCYDALRTDGPDNGLKLYKGIQYIKKKLHPTEFMRGKKVVFLGEIGIPEQRYTNLESRNAIIHNWDVYMGVCFALDVPYILQWELYCNEPKNENLRHLNDTRTTNEMRGFWLIRPDGSLSFTGAYFERLLKNAGSKLTSR